MNLRYLVTGGSGFVGSALVRRLVDTGNSVANLDALTYAAVPGALDSIKSRPEYRFLHGSITDLDLVRRTLAETEPQIVVNLAAESHVDRSIDSPATFIDTNVVGTSTMLRASLAYWASLPLSRRSNFRFIHVSTDEVFGSIELELATSETRYNPSSPYAASKAAADHLVRAWHRTYGLPTIVTNASNNYGPYQFPEKFIPRLVTRALTGRSLPVYGDGRHVRDWIHVGDHARAIQIVAEHGLVAATYLIGARSTLENREVASAICRALDHLAPLPADSSYLDRVELSQDRPGHDRRYAIDPSVMETSLGFEPALSFEEGIASTVSWYVTNRDWWEPILTERYNTQRLGTLE